MSIKVVFCWADISGYMAACWRSLSQHPDIDLYVLAFQARHETAFSDSLMNGVSSCLLSLEARKDTALIRQRVLEQKPDVLVLCGWLHKPFRQLVFDSAFKDTKFIMGMDTPWQGTLRQRVGTVLLKRYLNRMSHVVTTGERSWQYAKNLGIPTSHIHRGMYGIDYDSWSALLTEQKQTNWPRSFLFVGRYIPIKAIDILIAAYQRYRSQVRDPWSLVCCGKGELAHLLDNQPGVENKGFVQPDEMQTVWQEAGAFVLPSLFDPWPLALVEAAAAGLPIVCTHSCGSAVEVVRPWYNGLVVAENNIEQLTQAMLTIHQQYAMLPVW
ncbi:MAG: glycosyltransferase family 4 protein, partial [Cyanobacteria bacterium J06632_3]